MSRAMHPLAPTPFPPTSTAFYSPHITRGTRHHVRPVTSQQKSQRTKETHEMNETRSRERKKMRKNKKIIRDIRFDISPHCNPPLHTFEGFSWRTRPQCSAAKHATLFAISQQKTWQVNSTVKTGIYQSKKKKKHNIYAKRIWKSEKAKKGIWQRSFSLRKICRAALGNLERSIQQILLMGDERNFFLYIHILNIKLNY